MGEHSFKFGLLKKALPHIALRQMPDVWCRHNLASFDAESEGLSEQLSFAVNGRRRFRANAGILVTSQTVVNVVINQLRRYVNGTHVAECFTNRIQMRLKLRQATTAREFV